MAKPHIFGTSRGWLNPRQVKIREEIAAKHGAIFLDNVGTGTGASSWFECEESPLASTVEARVLRDLA